MRLTRHEVVLWAEGRVAQFLEWADDHRADAQLDEAAGRPGPSERWRKREADARRDADHFAFVVRALREADLDPQQSTGQVQDVPEVDAKNQPAGVTTA